MLRKRQEKLSRAADLLLRSQLGEEERFRDLLRRMARENKTAVVSFFLILLMILAAVFAPLHAIIDTVTAGLNCLHKGH